MTKHVKRFASLSLAAVLTFGGVPAHAAGTGVLTRREAAEMLLDAGSDYVPGLSLSNVLKGHPGGNLDQGSPATRLQALIMLDRAFGGLPAPAGDNARSAFPAEDFTDIPSWALAEIDDVLAARIVDSGGDGLLSPNQPITEDELDTLIRRVYALKGTNLRDDFYAAVNKEWLDNSEIPAGEASNGIFNGMGLAVDTQIAGMIREICANPQEEGTAESKIKALYSCVTDTKGRKETGVAPIQKYLDAIENAKTLDELMAADVQMREETAFSPLMGFGLEIDQLDSRNYIIEFQPLSPNLEKDFYANGSQAKADAYIAYLTTMFTLSGCGQEEAGVRAKAVCEAEKALAAASMDPQDQYDVDKVYNLYTLDQIQALFPGVDMDKAYAANGYQKTGKIIVRDVGCMEALAELFDDAHMDALKALAQQRLLKEYGKYLDPGFQNASLDFDMAYYGIDSRKSDEEVAAQMVQELLSDYLSRTYAETYFSPEAKADVEKMCREFIAIYRERLQTLDWMSETTKAKALKKLDAMNIKVGYPDTWDTYLDNAAIKSPGQGGTLFSNTVAIKKAEQDYYRALQNTPVDKTMWFAKAFEVNAFYEPVFNDITFPAAMLQAPFYDVNASLEENLGGIGFVIAHEITHAFDNNGSKYDETGKAANWWTDEDYAAFQKKCQDVIGWYNGQESCPGITCNGELTLSENVADLGSIQCVITTAKKQAGKAGPDFDRLFRALANCCVATATRQMREYTASIDVHAPDKLRCNRVLQTIPEFYATYGIQPGDGMWTEPDSRVSIW